MIEARIARLNLEGQQALETASAVGVVFCAEVCAALSKSNPMTLDKLFDALARRQQIIRRALSHPTKGAGSSDTYEYVIRRRVERAQRLISMTDDSLAQIATECGFAAQSHLSHLFYRIVGERLGAWRRAHVAPQAPLIY